MTTQGLRKDHARFKQGAAHDSRTEHARFMESAHAVHSASITLAVHRLLNFPQLLSRLSASRKLGSRPSYTSGLQI